MTYKRTDDNHTEIVQALRKIGAKVFSTASIGKGFPDLVVGYRGDLFLLEVKDGSKPQSKRKLTDDEAKFMQEWDGVSHIGVVNNIQEAIDFLNGKQKECENGNLEK